MNKIHMGAVRSKPTQGETTYFPGVWGTFCGRVKFDHVTNRWKRVTCKQCLRHMPESYKPIQMLPLSDTSKKAIREAIGRLPKPPEGE